MTREEKIRKIKILQIKRLQELRNGPQEEPSFLDTAGSFIKNIPSYIAKGASQPIETAGRLKATAENALGLPSAKPWPSVSTSVTGLLGKGVGYGMKWLSGGKSLAGTTLPGQDEPLFSEKYGKPYESIPEAVGGIGEAALNVGSLATLGGSGIAVQGLKELGKGLFKQGAKNLAKGVGIDTGIAAGFGATQGLQQEDPTLSSVAENALYAAPAGLVPLGVQGSVKLPGATGRMTKSLAKKIKDMVRPGSDVLEKEIDSLIKAKKSLTNTVLEYKKNGTDIQKHISSRDVYNGLRVENGSIVPDEAIAVMDNKIEKFLDTKIKMLPEADRLLPAIKKAELERRAIKNFTDNREFLPGIEKQKIAEIKEQFRDIPEELSISMNDDLRRRARNSSRDAKGQLKSDSAFAAIENASRDMLFEAIDSLPGAGKNEFANLGQYIKEMIDVKKFLNKTLRGQKVKGGQLGKYFGRTTGAIAGSPLGFFGSILGSELGGVVSDIIMNNQLGSSFKMKFISTITDDPKVLKEAQRLLRETKRTLPKGLPVPQSPAEKGVPYPIKTSGGSSINLPSKTQSSIELQEIAKLPKDPEYVSPKPFPLKDEGLTLPEPSAIQTPPPRQFIRDQLRKDTGVSLPLDITIPEVLQRPGKGKVKSFDDLLADRENVKRVRGENRMKDSQVFESLNEEEGKALVEILVEFDIAESGKRIYNSDGELVSGLPSSLPRWIPEEFRTKKHLDNITDVIFARKVPTKKEKEFLSFIYDEVQRRAGYMNAKTAAGNLDLPDAFR